MTENNPVPLGLKKSFGFGDRLGLATAGHLAACKKSGFAPIFAQQSIREMDRTDRSAKEVMQAAVDALRKAAYQESWGADADHLKTRQDINKTTLAGFTLFTIDPSEYVNDATDKMSAADLETTVAQMESEGVFLDDNWQSYYLSNAFEVSENITLRFEKEDLLRAAVKYGRAIAFTAQMNGFINYANAGHAFEVEVSVDETNSATSALEHLFWGLETKRRHIRIVSLAPRFVGSFEKGVDYLGDVSEFEQSLAEHVAIARYCGPYKLSVHSGSDKFTIYPIFGRLCGDLLHVKTAGTSYLEALRVIARQAPSLFGELVAFCRERFAQDKESYHISATSYRYRNFRN
jgi:tagaturonate epimerase